MTRVPKNITNYGGLRHLCSGKWDCHSHQEWDSTPTSMMEEDFAWKPHLISLMLNYPYGCVAFTTQSHRLTSLCGILDSLKSLQSNAIEDSQENSAKWFLSDTQNFKVKGQWRKIWGAHIILPSNKQVWV